MHNHYKGTFQPVYPILIFVQILQWLIYVIYKTLSILTQYKSHISILTSEQMVYWLCYLQRATWLRDLC